MTHVGNNDLPGVRFAVHMVGFNKYIYIYLNVTESWYMGDREGYKKTIRSHVGLAVAQ